MCCSVFASYASYSSLASNVALMVLSIFNKATQQMKAFFFFDKVNRKVSADFFSFSGCMPYVKSTPAADLTSPAKKYLYTFIFIKNTRIYEYAH